MESIMSPATLAAYPSAAAAVDAVVADDLLRQALMVRPDHDPNPDPLRQALEVRRRAMDSAGRSAAGFVAGGRAHQEPLTV